MVSRRAARNEHKSRRNQHLAGRAYRRSAGKEQGRKVTLRQKKRGETKEHLSFPLDERGLSLFIGHDGSENNP